MKVIFEAHECNTIDISDSAYDYGIGSVFECDVCKSLWRLEERNYHQEHDNMIGEPVRPTDDSWVEGYRVLIRITANNVNGVPFEHPMEILAR